MNPDPFDYIRPTRRELTAALLAAAEDAPLLANASPAAIGWGTQLIDVATTGGLWRLRVWWQPEELLGPLSAATGPGRRLWCYGCDRWPHWDAGATTVVLDPLRHLLSGEQRERLRERLLHCSCWPSEDPLGGMVPPLANQIWTPEEFDEMGRG